MALGGTKDNKPTRLKNANKRLDAAMGQLEKALAAQKPVTNPVIDDSEMAALRDENEKLKGLNKQTGERLDGAIERLQSVLKEV